MQQVFSNTYAFAALRNDSTVVTWGNLEWGGDSSAVFSQLTEVQQVFPNAFAFTALKSDGTVVTWGHSAHGGNHSAEASQLTGVVGINSVQTDDDWHAPSNTAPTFSSGTGQAIVPFGSGTDIGYSVIQQADGKLVVAGTTVFWFHCFCSAAVDENGSPSHFWQRWHGPARRWCWI